MVKNCVFAAPQVSQTVQGEMVRNLLNMYNIDIKLCLHVISLCTCIFTSSYFKCYTFFFRYEWLDPSIKKVREL